MSELFEKQVNAQKEINFWVYVAIGSRKPTKTCAMKMKETKKKKRGAPKIFLMERRSLFHGYQTTLGQRFLMH